MAANGHEVVFQYPAAADPALPPALEEARFTGWRGGHILQHRAMTREPYTPARLLAGVVLLVVLLEVWLLSLDAIVMAWAQILEFWRQVFGWDGYVVIVDYSLGVSAPYLAVGSGTPGGATWILGALLTIGLVVASLFLPRRLLPVAYLLRIAAFFQASAQVFFLLWPGRFPYSASGYVHGMLIAGLAFITLTPLLLALTYYVLDFSLGKKLGLTLLVMGHMTLLVPLQYMAHAVILHHTSLLFLPILFFVFGLPLEVLLFVAFYAWGVSWRSRIQNATSVPTPEALADAGNVS